MSTPDKICTDSCKGSDDACNVNDMLQNMSMTDKDMDNVSICANCGKEDANNTCNKCKTVKYCNAACKKKHRHKHKKECEEHKRLAAEHATKLRNEELRLAAEKHDEELFKQPPPEEDCPICFIRLPLGTGMTYMSCCGKRICNGCIHAPVYDNQGNLVDINKQNECPFCRDVAPKSDAEIIKRTKKRAEKDDPFAIYKLGVWYDNGLYGYPQDCTKALEHYHRAGELGDARAYNSIGYSYEHGEGVGADMKKAKHYYEQAAMGGDSMARQSLGNSEVRVSVGNMDRALRHYMIAVKSGESDSLENVKRLYSAGYATKEDYMKALQAYQEYLGEIKSVQRDKAVAAHDKFKYYGSGV